MSGEDVRGTIGRRVFLKNLAGLGLGGIALAGCARAAGAAAASPAGAMAALRPTPDRIGVQLYTVRDLLQQDFEGTLEQVAEVGYRQVEFAGYYGRTPEQVRALLDRLGLRAPSTHIGANAVRQDLPAQIRTAKTIGHEYITLPSFPIDRDNADVAAWRQVAAEFNRMAETIRREDLRFAYHNHAWEFQRLADGRTGFDVLLADTDPALVDFELDLYWVVHAGHDPIQLFQQHPGRFTMWHVKDMREPQGAREMVPVGQGSIDFPRIFAHAEQSGLRHFFVEHDNAANTVGSLPSIQASYQYLQRLLT
jgi:sugar phosphate isomerase/epimerase